MKILHISTGFSIDFQGGITNYVRNLAIEQSNLGHDVYVMCDGGKENCYKIFAPKSKILPFSYTKKTDNNNLKQIKLFINSSNFDIIHIHMTLNTDQRLWTILKNKKYIVSLHDYSYICPRICMKKNNNKRCEIANFEVCCNCFTIFDKLGFGNTIIKKILGEKIADNFPIKSKSIYRNWINNNKKLLENAQLLLPVSNRVKEIYVNSEIKNIYKVLHIGNISALDFNKSKPINNDSGLINMIILSSVSDIKGGSLICELLEQVNNDKIKVHFFGRCDEKQLKMIESVGIIYHGSYNQEQLKDILKNFDMGIMVPIWEDNGPQVVMEMLNNHLPVFATKMGGITDFVNDSNGFLFDPYDEEEKQRAIIFLNNLSNEKILELRKNIKRTLTPKEHFEEMVSVYNEVLRNE